MSARLVLLAVLLAGCATSSEVATVEVETDRYGYRLGGAAGGRETVAVAPPDSTIRYLTFPAVIDSVDVRPAGRPAPGDGVAVEAVILGAFPDACSVLSGVEQTQSGHYASVTLVMRQPLETVCAAVVRPFRFYLTLDSPFEVGSYTLTVNGSAYPFQVLPPLPVR